MPKIFNATRHDPTTEQAAEGVGKPRADREFAPEESFDAIRAYARGLVVDAKQEGHEKILVGGLTSFCVALWAEASEQGLRVVEATSDREIDENRRFVFCHRGFREIPSPLRATVPRISPTLEPPESRSSRFRGFVRQFHGDRINYVYVGLFAVAVGAWLLATVRQYLEGVWGGLEAVVGITTLLAVAFGWIALLLKSTELSDEIRITLQCDEYPRSAITLPYRPLRAQVSRSEIQGIVGLYSGKEPYAPEYLRRVIESSPKGVSPLGMVLRGERDDLPLVVEKRVFEKVWYELPAGCLSGPTPFRPEGDGEGSGDGRCGSRAGAEP
jgi:hypothetical protein